MDAGVSCAGRSLCWLLTYPPEYMHTCVHARVHVCVCVHMCVCVCVHLTDLGACSPLALSHSLSLVVESLLFTHMRRHARERGDTCPGF